MALASATAISPVLLSNAIGITTGREEGISIGLERGAHQNKLETAKNLLAEGLAPQVVARCTTLPLETVLELAQEL